MQEIDDTDIPKEMAEQVRSRMELRREMQAAGVEFTDERESEGEDEMKDVIAKVQKCRDDTALRLCEDMYAKYPDGTLVKFHSKEAGEEQVRQLDSIIEALSAMENESPNVELTGAAQPYRAASSDRRERG